MSDTHLVASLMLVVLETVMGLEVITSETLNAWMGGVKIRGRRSRAGQVGL